MSKFINLDDFDTESQKTFQFGGKKYAIKPMGFGTFITLTNKRQKLESLQQENANPVEIYEMLSYIVKACVPEMSEEELNKMSVDQLVKLTDYIQEMDKETAEVAKEIEGN